MLTRWLSTAIMLLALVSCGSSDGFEPDVPTDSPPIVTRVEPNSGGVGTEITLFGLGFSIAVPENIVIVGGIGASATSYRLLSNPTSSEIEALTVNVPAGAALGEGPIYVVVQGNVSNADVSFTVTP